MPQVVALVLTAFLTVVQTLNAVVFKLGSPWSGYLALITVVLGFYHVTGVGPNLAGMLKLPPWVSRLVGVILGTLAYAQTQLHVSGGIHLILADVLIVTAALGFDALPAPLPATLTPQDHPSSA